MQAETTIYFLFWWVLFEYTSLMCSLIKHYPALVLFRNGHKNLNDLPKKVRRCGQVTGITHPKQVANSTNKVHIVALQLRVSVPMNLPIKHLF